MTEKTVDKIDRQRFVTFHIFCNGEAPLQFQFHSVPEATFLQFLMDIEDNRASGEIVSLRFDLPGKKQKVFNIDPCSVVAVDSVISPESGKPQNRIVIPGENVVNIPSPQKQ